MPNFNIIIIFSCHELGLSLHLTDVFSFMPTFGNFKQVGSAALPLNKSAPKKNVKCELDSCAKIAAIYV